MSAPHGVIHMSVPTLPDVPAAMLKKIEERGCCIGSAMRGAEYCTCWEPVYDLEQKLPRPKLASKERSSMCADCAYRTDSPERQGADHVQGSEDELMNLPASGQPFFCHQGIRRPIRWVHAELGLELPGADADYRPPIIEKRPFKADGSPADICGGWAAQKKAMQR